MKDFKAFYIEQKNKIPRECKKDLEFLFKERLNLDSLEFLFSEKKITKEQEKLLERDTDRLRLGCPLAYILKSQEFLNFDYYVDERVFIPRPETEYLAYWIINQILRDSKSSYSIMDIGAGSGCIGISLLKHSVTSHCVFIENSMSAREVLKINLEKAQINPQRYYICNSLNEAQKIYHNRSRPINLVVSNPPYISRKDSLIEKSVIDYEPHKALFAKQEGLEYLLKWSDWAIRRVCTREGLAFFEFGLGQDLILKESLKDKGVNFKFLKDQYNKNRFLFLQKQ